MFRNVGQNAREKKINILTKQENKKQNVKQRITNNQELGEKKEQRI